MSKPAIFALQPLTYAVFERERGINGPRWLARIVRNVS